MSYPNETNSGMPPRRGVPPWAFCIIIPCGCSVLAIPVIAAILFPVFAQARNSARTSLCTSNVRTQTFAILMYAQDYDETLPPAKSWMDAIYPYAKNDSQFRCPEVSSKNKADYGYAYNSRLDRKVRAKISRPEKTILTYDSTQTTKNSTDAVQSLPSPPRHSQSGGVNIVGYEDGHARAVRPADMDPSELK